MEEKSLRQRLNETFSRYNWVRIRNPLKTNFSWTVALEQNEILDMLQPDSISEQEMAQKGGGQFLPTEGLTKRQSRLIPYDLSPGEAKMVPGEAAYVLVPRLLSKAIREKYGSGKAGLSKLNVPHYQDEFLPQILVGPIVKDVGKVMSEFAGSLDTKIEEGFAHVDAEEPKRRGRPPKVVLETNQ